MGGQKRKSTDEVEDTRERRQVRVPASLQVWMMEERERREEEDVDAIGKREGGSGAK